MPFFRLRKISKKPAAGTVNEQQISKTATDLTDLERRLSAAEEELDSDDTDQVTRDSRITALEGKFDDQADLVQDFLNAYNANQAKKTVTPRTNTISITMSAVESGVTRTRTLYPLSAVYETGQGWDIEFKHATLTSNAWTTGTLPEVPAGTTIEVRAVETGTNTLITASTVPTFLGWTGALESVGNTNSTSIVMPSSGTTIGANVRSTAGENLVYSVIGDQENGAFTRGKFSGKIRVTVSGFTNTTGGSQRPVADAFYRLSSWYNTKAQGKDKFSKKSFSYSKPNQGKLTMNFGQKGQVANANWEFPLGDGAGSYEVNGYPVINWAPNSEPSTLAQQEAILGPTAGARTMPQKGDNEYVFDLDLSARPGATDLTRFQIGFRAWASESRDNSGNLTTPFPGYSEDGGRYGNFWIKIEPIENEGEYHPS